MLCRSKKNYPFWTVLNVQFSCDDKFQSVPIAVVRHQLVLFIVPNERHFRFTKRFLFEMNNGYSEREVIWSLVSSKMMCHGKSLSDPRIDIQPFRIPIHVQYTCTAKLYCSLLMSARCVCMRMANQWHKYGYGWVLVLIKCKQIISWTLTLLQSINTFVEICVDSKDLFVSKAIHLRGGTFSNSRSTRMNLFLLAFARINTGD